MKKIAVSSKTTDKNNLMSTRGWLDDKDACRRAEGDGMAPNRVTPGISRKAHGSEICSHMEHSNTSISYSQSSLRNRIFFCSASSRSSYTVSTALACEYRHRTTNVADDTVLPVTLAHQASTAFARTSTSPRRDVWECDSKHRRVGRERLQAQDVPSYYRFSLGPHDSA